MRARRKIMFAITWEGIRKDRYGLPEERVPYQAILLRNLQAGRCRNGRSLMAGYDPILSSNIHDHPAYERSPLQPMAAEVTCWLLTHQSKAAAEMHR